MTLESWTDFDVDAYTESVASIAGIDVDFVKVESVDYTVSSTYVFPAAMSMSDDECVAAVVSTVRRFFWLAERDMTCMVGPSQKRSAGFLSDGRYLQEGVPVKVVISTTDLDVAKRLQESATNTAAISSKLSEVTGTTIEEPTVSVAAAAGVKVTTRIDAAVSAFAAEELASEYERRTGKVIKSVEVITPSTTTTINLDFLPNLGDSGAESNLSRASPKTIFSTVAMSIVIFIATMF